MTPILVVVMQNNCFKIKSSVSIMYVELISITEALAYNVENLQRQLAGEAFQLQIKFTYVIVE